MATKCARTQREKLQSWWKDLDLNQQHLNTGVQCCDPRKSRSMWMALKPLQGEASSLQAVDQSSLEGATPRALKGRVPAGKGKQDL